MRDRRHQACTEHAAMFRRHWTLNPHGLVPIIAIALLTGCAFQPEMGGSLQKLRNRAVVSPAQPRSGMPNFGRGPDGTLFMSWVERGDSGMVTLLCAEREPDGWSRPIRVAGGDDWFVNWADVPAIGVGDEGNMLAGWPQKVGAGTYAYDVRFTTTTDGGHAWSEAFPAHGDRSETEHGFLSLEPIAPDRFVGVWLDGREMVRDDGPMTLRAAIFDADGSVSDGQLLDDMVCECCPTSVAVTGNGTVVAVYRDRSDTELRNTGVVRYHNGSWSSPQIIHNDNWEIAGCPVNGPAVAARGSRVAVAWFTMGADDQPRVLAAFSFDHGETFGAPVRIDHGDAEGRVDITFADDASVIISWLELANPTTTQLMVRHVGVDGMMSRSTRIAHFEAGRACGMPKLETTGREVVVAWTDPSGHSRVKTAVIPLK